ncbi:hypothetical protein BYT27DRAFT_7161990 [Phlegmacium glaucopus]|nr:hypothetical protein BYT27DRAFT_7161990 [Phlegmacium glaucopus]
MSTTTQILFNSPALHSLKRDQLVKLCKIHAIKANGKNVDLIQRLQQHAQTLPKDSPLSIAARSDNPEVQQEEEVRDDVSFRSAMPRPSEQWEVVMDSIVEVEENSEGTLSSQRIVNNSGTTGEFGTGSSRSTTVSSSIKAFATSWGLKRNPIKPTPSSTASSRISNHVVTEVSDELARNSTPYASLPPPSSPPQTDHFVLNPPRMSLDGDVEIPLPGHVLRPGIPAPANARLSLGLGLGVPSTPTRQSQPTTTIRLISNPFPSVNSSYGAGENGTPQLQPFNTTFDLILGSPTPSGVLASMSTWPPRDPEDDVPMKGIYPTLTADDLPPSLVSIGSPQAKADRREKNEDVAMPGLLTPAHARTSVLGSPEPFIFGSPLPQHNVTNTQFRVAAASVLEEMNKRLREEGVDEIQTDIIAKLRPGASVLHGTPDGREIKPMPGAKRGEIKEKFQKLHESEFERMEGIDGLMKRRTERSPQKREEKEKVVIGKKRKSNAIEKGSVDGLGPHRPSAFVGRASSTRVISNGRRSKVVIPGAFGSKDEEEDEAEEDARTGKRVRMDPEVQSSLLGEGEKKSEQEIRLQRENEAIRKRLEANRARRRSSAAHGGLQGRKSGRISSGRPSLLGKPKPKPSRFGFLSSAKSLVQSVWNRGKAPAPVAASNIPKPSPANANVSTKPAPAPTAKAKVGPPPLGPTKKSSIAPARPTTAVASGSRIPSMRNANNKADGKSEEEGKLAVPNGNAIGKGTNTSTSSSRSRSRSPLPSFTSTSASRNSLQSNAGTRTSRTSSVVGGPASRNSSLVGTGISRNSGNTAGVSSIGTRISSTRMSSTGAISSVGSKKALGGASVTSRTSSTGSSRLSSMTSRLFAPTASSLAKGSRPSPGGGGLKAVSEDRQHPPLGMITNSSALHSPEISSPNSRQIFSKPLLLPQQSGIPTPVKNQRIASNDSMTLARTNSIQRSLTGRKPRISRSKVIARLASQRAANGSGSGNGKGPLGNTSGGLAPRASNDTASGRTRSSLGAKISRASYGGGTRSRASGGGNVLMSAKKRARQSEYARRKSRVVAPLVLDRDRGSMDVDDSQ